MDWTAGVRFPAEAKKVFFSTEFTPTLGFSQPPIHWILGPLSWPGREADHSPPSSAEVKNGGAIPPLPHTSSLRSV
jgi:hypothetical protein